MHWLLRVAIAVVVGITSGAGCYATIIAVFNRWIQSQQGIPSLAVRVGVGVVLVVAALGVPSIVGITLYVILTRRYGPEAPDRETRCRKCGYILRGITEPRCPECGERI